MAYVQYDFNGETFVTEAVQQNTFSPVFDYKFIHHVNNVTQEFIDYLKTSVEMQIHITQHIDAPADKIGTSNAIVKESIATGEAKGYESLGKAKPKSEAEVKVDKLQVSLAGANDENAELKKRIAELEVKILELEGPKSGAASKLEAALTTDAVVNG